MRQWKISLLLVALLVVAACASTGGTTTKIIRLTKQDVPPDTVHIARSTSTDPRLPPLDMTVTDVPTVLNLYNQAFALPEFTPAGTGTPRSCGIERGIIYTLTFYRGGQDILDLSGDQNTCSIVVLGTNDYRQGDTAFQAALSAAIRGPVADSH